jgi:hypothetical protein
MTEGEWLAATDPVPMLEFLAGKASVRKLRLFACGCVRTFWQSMSDSRGTKLVDFAELYADGKTTAAAIVREMCRISYGTGILWILRSDASEAARRWAGPATTSVRPTAPRLLRDIFPNPCRFVPGVEPPWLAWHRGTLTALASAIYDTGDFDRLPLLADAVEDAGCADADLLDHLRGPGPHVRGCWALDLVLGKS